MTIPDLGPVGTPVALAAVLLATLLLGLWGVWELVAGARRRRLIAARSALAELEQRSTTPLARFDAVVRRTEPGRWLGRRLARSGVDVRVGTFVVLLAVTCLVAVVVIWRMLAPLLGVLSVLGVAALFFAYLRRQEDRRREEFTAQLPELARVLSNAASAGLALPTAIDMAADELDDPAGTELRQMANSLKLGMPFDEALRELRERMPSREIGVLSSTLLVASRSGGSLVAALRNISDTLESRKETRREIRTILGESTVTSWALAALFVTALFGINIASPGVLRTMSSEPLGQVVLLVSLGLIVLGIVLVRIVTRIRF